MLSYKVFNSSNSIRNSSTSLHRWVKHMKHVQKITKYYGYLSHTVFFSEHLLVTVHLCLLTLTFAEIFFFFWFLGFLFLFHWRHYIRFFENTIVCSCMRFTSVILFSANWGRLHHFDKNGIYWGELQLYYYKPLIYDVDISK